MENGSIEIEEKNFGVKVKITDDLYSFSGGHWIANCDIQPGEILIDELPLIYGPMFDKDDHRPMCISCCSVINCETVLSCSRCSFPVCSLDCEKDPIHADNECKLFEDKADKYELDSTDSFFNRRTFSMCLLMLRGIRLKLRNFQMYEKLIALKDHNPTNKDKQAVYDETPNAMLEKLKSFMESEPSLDYPDEIYAKIFHVFRFNNFFIDETKVSNYASVHNRSLEKFNKIVIGNSDGDNLTKQIRCYAIYPKSSRINQTCVPNCTWSISPEQNFTLRIRACRSIMQGEELTIPWIVLPTLEDTAQDRQQALINTYGGMCLCVRCEDPTELGIYSAAINCANPKCKDKSNNCKGEASESGYYLPESPFDITPDAVWECNRCEDTLKLKDIREIVGKFKSCFEKSVFGQQKPRDMVQVFRYAFNLCQEGAIHKNHGFMTEITLRILEVLKEIKIMKKEISDDQIKWIRGILQLREKIYPGLSKQRATLLMDLSNAISYKLETFGYSSLSMEELENDYILFMEASKEAFQFYMDDFKRPREGFNHFATMIFQSMKITQNKWEVIIEENGTKLKTSEYDLFKIFLFALDSAKNPLMLKSDLRNILKFS